MCTSGHKRMNRGIHKIICFVLAAALFLAGMYVDTITADSLFVCDSMGKTASCLRSYHTDINDGKVCTTEMLDECSGMELQPCGRYQEQKREIEESLSLLYANLISFSQGKSVAYPKITQFLCQAKNELLTEYMHQSDGKKRI